MRVKLLLYKLSLLFFILIQELRSTSCTYGCIQCDQNTGACLQCEEGFMLDTLTQYCTSQQCEEGFFLQVHESTHQKECVAICDNNFYQNKLQKTCSKLEQCTQSFSTNQNVNRGDNVKNILSFNKESGYFLLIQHSNYFIQIKRQNGEYEQTLDLPSDTLQIQKFGENLIVLSQNSTLYNWDIQKNTQQLLTKISYQKVEVYKVQLIQIGSIVCFLLIDSDRNIVIIDSLFNVSTLELIENQEQLEIPYSSQDSIQFIDNFLFISNNQIWKVYEIQQANPSDSQKILFKSYNLQNSCANIPSQSILSVEKGISSPNLIIIIQQIPALYILTEQSCSQVVTQQIPSQSKVVVYNNQDYYVIQYSNSIQIIDNQFTLVDSIDFTPIRLVDLIGQKLFEKDNYFLTLFVLLSDSTLNQYEIQLTPSSLKFINTNQTIKVLIKRPQNLFILDPIYDKNNQQVFQKRLFIAYEDVQSLVIQQSNIASQNLVEKTEYTISNFELKQKTYRRIVSLLPLEDQMLLLGCSRDGQLLAWDISNVFDDQYLYALQLSADTCIELIPFNSSNTAEIIAVFSKQIFLIDVVSLEIKKTWNQVNQKMKYSFKDDNAAFLIDSNLFISKSSDITNQQKLAFTGSISDISNIYLELGSYLLVQKSSSLDIYSISGSTLTKLKAYTTNSKILLIKVRNFPIDYQTTNNKKFEISLFQQDQQFILMNEDLIPYQIVKGIPLTSIIDVQFIKSDPYDTFYFVLGKTNKTISSSPYPLFLVQKGIVQFTLLFEYVYASQFIEPIKYFDTYNNPIYDIKLLSNKGAMSTLISNSYDPTRNVKFIEQVQQIIGQTGIKLTPNSNKKLFFGRNFIGKIYAGNYKITQYKLRYQVSQQDILDGKVISDVSHSYQMNKYFILTNSILVFNIHTKQLIEEIAFTLNENDSIQQFQVYPELNIILARKKNILVLKNYETYKTYEKQSLKEFTSFFIDKPSASIIVTGDSLIKLNMNLEEISSIDLPINSIQLKEIKYTQKVIICNLMNSDILFIDFSSFKIITNISPTIKTPFEMHLDTKLERVFLYNSIVDVYSYNGTFLQRLALIDKQITKIKTYETYTLFLTSTKIVITDSKSLKILDVYSIPGEGNVQKVFYIKDFNHLAISSDNIRDGQIFIYNLSQLQQLQVLSNQFNNNYPYNVVDMIYDSYSNIFTYLDEHGNIYSIDYAGAYQLINVLKIKELQFDDLTPLAMKLNFQLNEIFVFSQSTFYIVNYGGFTEYQKIYSINSNNIFFQTQVQLKDKTQDIFIILGEQNILFQYSNYKFSYLYYLTQSEKIKDISLLSQNQILLVLSQEYLILQANFDIDNLANSISSLKDYSLNNYQFSFFLCSGIFYSLTHSIVQYDFINQQVIFEIPLNQSQTVIQSQLFESLNLLVIGLNDGTIIFYDLIAKKYTQSSLISNQYSDSVRYIKDSIDHIWIATTGSQVLQVDKNNINLQTTYDFSAQARAINNRLSNFEIDGQYNRLFLSYQGERKIICIDTSQLPNQKVVYQSFPSKQYNRILISENQIIFYSTSQLNIHDRKSLKYLTSIRRQGLYDSIQMVSIFLEKYYFILSQRKFEIILVDLQKGQKTLIDQVIVDQLSIMKINLESNDTILRVVGTSRYQIFDQKYSLNLYLQNNEQLSSLSTINQHKCGLDLIGKSYLEMTQAIKLIRPDYLQLPSLMGIVEIASSSLNRQFNYYLDKQDLSEMNIDITKQSEIIISPYPGYSNNIEVFKDLELPNNSLSNYNKDKLSMKNFNFKIISSNIPFNNQIDTIYLQKISITNQNLNDVQLSFAGQNQIVIQQLKLENLYLTYNQNQKSLFNFSGCGSISIDQLVLKNVTFNGVDNYLINIDQAQTIYIKNLRLENSYFNSMIQITNSQKLMIDDVVIQNSNSFSSNLIQTIPDIIHAKAIQNIQISNIKMKNNTNIKFIESSNSFQLSEELIKLDSVSFILSKSEFQSNNFTQFQNISLINVSAQTIDLKEIIFIQNQGNLLLQETSVINIEYSQFQNNSNLNGGALSVYLNSDEINIVDSKFISNVALANGGALFLQEAYGVLTMDKLSVIQGNSALIGGGIRILNSQQTRFLKSIQQKMTTYNITNNFASIYGQNTATMLSKLLIRQVFEKNTKKQEIDYEYLGEQDLNEEDSKEYSGIIKLKKFNSGSELSISFKLLDSNDDVAIFDVNFLKNHLYPQIIEDELRFISFKIDNYDTSQLLINGDTQLDSFNYNMTTSSFGFDKMQMMSFPSSTYNLSLNFTTFKSYTFKPILLQISFRNCEVGEILQQHNENIYRCYECPKDYYSLKHHSEIQRNQTKEIREILIENKCLSCPYEAVYCQGSLLQLKQGYWRSKNQADDILYCYGRPQNCDYNVDTNQNCIEGMVGPLCEECDSFGEVWGGDHYTLSYTNDFECTKCNQIFIPIILIFILTMVIFLYCLMSIIMFLSGFSHNQICYYLRKLQIMPISKSCFKDYSSFYLKILINFMQITSYIIDTHKLFPDNINTTLVLIQSPSFYFISIVDCMTNRLVGSRISRIHLIQFLMALFPFFCIFVVTCLVKILYRFKLIQVNRSYMRTLINLMIVFFQPSQITFFTNAMSCRVIGQNSYTKLDLLIECNDTSYMKFAMPFSLSVLAFWITIPLIIFFQLRKKKNILNYCKTKFQFGYFYSEYNEKYYYWEFIRIYIRIAIVMVFTLISFLSFVNLVVIFLLLLYIKLILKTKPIVNKDLQRIDVISIIILIVCILLTRFNQQYNFLALSIFTYLIFLAFTVVCIYMVASEKLNSELNIFGRFLRWAIKILCSKSVYEKFIQKNKVKFSTYQRWRTLKKKIHMKIVSPKSMAIRRSHLNLEILTKNIKPISKFFFYICLNKNLLNYKAKPISNSPTDSPDSFISNMKNEVKLYQKVRKYSGFQRDKLEPIQETVDSIDFEIKDEHCLSQNPYISSMLMFSDKRMFRENNNKSSNSNSENNSIENFRSSINQLHNGIVQQSHNRSGCSFSFSKR